MKSDPAPPPGRILPSPPPPRPGETPSNSQMLARPAATPHAWDDVRFQKLWLATQRRQWRSIAVVGASRGVDTVGVAEMLAKIAWWYRGEPSCVFDLRDASLRLVEYQVHEITAQVEAGLRVVIALRSIAENPTAIPLARAADSVVLCIGLGTTEFRSAEQTISEVGRERVIGSIVIKSHPIKKGNGGGAK